MNWTHGMIHCTDTPANMDVRRSHIEQWHLVENGWSRVGYAGLVQRDGILDWMIPFDRDDVIDSWEISNGAAGWNGRTKHIAWAGGANNQDTRTYDQVLTLTNTVLTVTMLYPEIKWIGHNQVNANKYCPAFSVPDFCQEIGVADKNIDFKTYYR